MIKVGRIPKELKDFFAPLASQFTRSKTFQNFQAVVLAFALMQESRNVTRISRMLAEGSHQTRLNKLLNSSAWDGGKVLRELARLRLADFNLKPGDSVRVILDDTKRAKRGKEIPGVGKFFDPALKVYRKGHVYVVCLLEVNGEIIPWGISLYLKKEWCEANRHPFKKLTELAAELIQSIPDFPSGVEITVLFDSYYLCQTVVDAIRKEWGFISCLKSNRNILVGREQRKAGTYARNLIRRRGHNIRLKHGCGKTAGYRVAGKQIRIPSLGEVVLVGSRRSKEKKIVALATNRLDLVDREIVSEYGHRWIIEVFFKETKQNLGLGEYQTRCLEGAVKHLHLSLIAFTLLTYAKKKRRAPAKTKEPVLPSFSVEKLQIHLRHLVGRDSVEYISDRRKKPERQIHEIKKLFLEAA